MRNIRRRRKRIRLLDAGPGGFLPAHGENTERMRPEERERMNRS
jgi:hypothetical protein